MIHQQERSDAVMRCTQTVNRVASGSEGGKLESHISTRCCNGCKLKTHAEIAESACVVQRTVNNGRKLNRPLGYVREKREALVGGVLQAQMQFLRVQAYGDPRTRPGSVLVVSRVARRQKSVTSAFGVEEFGAVGILYVEIPVKTKPDFASHNCVFDI